MPRAILPIIDAAPLLVAGEIAELRRLGVERDELKCRLQRLPPRAHSRIILEHRLAQVVASILRLEGRLYRSGS